MYRFSGPSGGTTPSVVLEVGSWFRVTYITNPTVNFWGPWIDLSKCVPQDVLFKDYVNAIAATYNIEFVVNDNEKIVTLKLNETDISAEPEHKEDLWRANAEKPIIELRDAKYKYLDYAWSGTDALFSNNFKSYPAADYIGEVGAYWQIVLDYEADETYANKKLRAYSENKIYVCEFIVIFVQIIVYKKALD